MERVERSIEVGVPVGVAYNQWTQFEEFPRFMQGVESVRQMTGETVHWVASIAGRRKEWDAHITEQVPDGHIAWMGFGDADNRGLVSFEALGHDRTRVNVAIEYEVSGVVEKVGDAAGVVGRRVEGDLERFRGFVESRGSETGAWRGEIHEGRTEQGDPMGLGPTGTEGPLNP